LTEEVCEQIPLENVADAGEDPGHSLQHAKKRAPINVIANWASFIVNFGLTFVIAPLLVHRLGTAEYGVWTLIGDIIGYSWILGLGIGLAVAKFGAEYYALKRNERFNSLVSTSLLLNLGSSAVLLAIGVYIAYAFPALFPLPPAMVRPAQISLLLVAVGVATAFPGATFTGCLVALSRYDWIGVRTTASAIVRAGLLWYVLEHGGGLISVAVVSLAANLLAFGIEVFFVKLSIPTLAIGVRHFDKTLLKPLMTFSSYGFLLSVASRLIYMTDTLVIGFVLDPVAVTFYAIGAKLPLVLRDSLGNITNLYFPFASQMHALGRNESLQKLFVAGARIASLYMFPGAIGLSILGPAFLELWMGPGFGSSSGPVLVVLAWEALIFGASASAGYVLFGMGKHNMNAWVSVGNAGMNLLLSIFLIRSLGPMGVAWGTLIPALIANGLVLPVYTARLLKVPVRDFYFAAYCKPLIAALPLSLWFGAFVHQHLLKSVLGWAACLTGGLVLYALVAWKTATEQFERDIVRNFLLRHLLKRATR
jgi:O-antigen/teichoic acid export membrane protein